MLAYPHSSPVCAMKKAMYKNLEFELHPGDCIFVYTDGVPEATNSVNEMYGDERLLDTLNVCPNAEPEELIRHMHDAVARFAGSAEQFDDITMLCLRYAGAQEQK